jgi:hypothetical protein
MVMATVDIFGVGDDELIAWKDLPSALRRKTARLLPETVEHLVAPAELADGRFDERRGRLLLLLPSSTEVSQSRLDSRMEGAPIALIIRDVSQID